MSRFSLVVVAGALLTGCAAPPEPFDVVVMFGLLALRSLTQRSVSPRH